MNQEPAQTQAPDEDMSRVPQFLQERIKAMNTDEPVEPQSIATDNSISRNVVDDTADDVDPELSSRVEELRKKLQRFDEVEREAERLRSERERLAQDAEQMRSRLQEIEAAQALEINDDEKALLGGDEGVGVIKKIVDRLAAQRAKEIEARVEQEMAKRLGEMRAQAIDEFEKRKASEVRAQREREFNERILKAIPDWNKIARSKELAEVLANDIRSSAIVKEIFTSKNASDSAIEALKEVVAIATAQNAPQAKYQATPSFVASRPSNDFGVDSVSRARAMARNGKARHSDVSDIIASLYQ